MGAVVTEAAPAPVAGPTPVRSRALPPWYRDRHGWLAGGIYLLVVGWYEHLPIAHLGTVCSCQNSDPTQWMWAWRWILYAIEHGENPLFTHLIWAGERFNLAAVTLAPLTAIPGIPLSALLGYVAAYNLIAFSAPVICGWAAYRLCRYLTGAPWVSILAGYTYGFSAYEIGHLYGHLNLIFIFVPPMLILVVLRYLDGLISRRRLVISAGVLVLIQFGLSTEMLFDTTYMGAVALIFAVIWLPGRRRRLLEATLLLLAAYVVVGAICAYYIVEALSGPAESAGISSGFPADLLSVLFPTPSFRIGGNRFAALASGFYTPNYYEQNSYLGLPLLSILLAFCVTTWRQSATRIIALTTLVAFILSCGTTLVVDGHPTFTMPFNWLAAHLPLFGETTPSRLGLYMGLGATLAAALWLSQAGGRGNRIWRWLVALAAVAFLIPNPNPVVDGRINRPAQPAFFRNAALYQKYIRPGETVMTIPFSQGGEEMLWQAQTGMYFRLAGGYLGYPPPRWAAVPLIHIELYGGSPAPAMKIAVRWLRSLVRQNGARVVLVESAAPQNWPAVLARAQFHHVATVGGMQVWTPPPDLRSPVH